MERKAPAKLAWFPRRVQWLELSVPTTGSAVLVCQWTTLRQQPRQFRSPAEKRKLLLEFAEIQVVSRAGDFAEFPIRSGLQIERRGPRLYQRPRIFHDEVDLHVILVGAPEALRHVQLGAVRM